jgi:peptide/nickel transport system permease protein
MASIELALSAFVFAVMSALSFALVSVRYRGSWIDGFGRGIALVALGIPVFWLGLLLLLVFSVHAGVTPGPEGQLSASTVPPPSVTGFVTVDALIAGQWSTFADAVWHLILPTIALALAPAAYMFRLLRSSMLETSREPFLIVVRSKGLSRWQATRRHVLPNALLPVVTASGLILAELLTGAVLVETVFAWPGMGALFTDSIVKKDYGVAQVIIVLIALSYVVINAGVDVLYGILDPRIRRANPGA